MSTKNLFEDHKHPHEAENVVVFGSGNFGTCLADHLAVLGHNVTITSRSEEVCDSINTVHRNPKYLSDCPLTPALKATTKLTPELIKASGVLLFSIPTQNMRTFVTAIAEYITEDHVLLFVNKGIEVGTMKLPCDILKDLLPAPLARGAVFLSGPSFAAEVVRREITCVSVASKEVEKAKRVKKMFHAPFFRVYISDDPIGVEVAGALKNVIAIASGVVHGLGLQMNARSAVITRGLASIAEVGAKLGAKPTTFLGLSGVGDLVLTCSSTKSRNFTVGYRLGQGETLSEITKSLGSVAEGVPTTEAAYKLCKDLKVSSPIIEEMYEILFNEKPIDLALKDLLWREVELELNLTTVRRKSSIVLGGESISK